MAVSDDNKAIAVYLKSKLGGAPKISKFWDDNKVRNVDIFSLRDVPVAGVSTYATVGLSDSATGLTSGGFSLGVELLVALATSYEDAENIIASCAFSIMNLEIIPKPGSIISRIIELYYPTGNLPNAFLMSPFLWDVATQEFATKKAAWLQIVPISEAESRYADQNGADALEDLFVEHQIDIFTLERPSVL